MDKKRSKSKFNHVQQAIIIIIAVILLVITIAASQSGFMTHIGKAFAPGQSEDTTKILSITKYDRGELPAKRPDSFIQRKSTALPSEESQRAETNNIAGRAASQPRGGEQSKGTGDYFRTQGKLANYKECTDDYQCVSHLCGDVMDQLNNKKVKICTPCNIGFQYPSSSSDKLYAYQTFNCAQGTSGNAGFICNEKFNCELVAETGDKITISQPELTDKEIKQYKSCITEMCYDTEVPWDTAIAGTVFTRRKATSSDLTNPKIPIFDKEGNLYTEDSYNTAGEFWTCDPHPDYCKNQYLVESFCKSENTPYGVVKTLAYPSSPLTCECGCKDGACLPGPCKPDLAISFKQANAEICVDALSFEVCNIGSSNAVSDTNALITINNKDAIVPLTLSAKPLKPKECVILDDPNKLSFSYFNMEYNKEYQIVSSVDNSNTIDEIDETNNEHASQLKTPPGYYDGKQYCLCGCTEGICLECPKFPELQIKKIGNYPKNQLCQRYIPIEFCNLGEASITNEFIVKVSAEGKHVELPVNPATLNDGEMKPEQCLLLSDKVTIDDFGLKDNNVYEIIVNLDDQNTIKELIEENNEEKAIFSTNEGYHDGTQYCKCGCLPETGKCIECKTFPDLIINSIDNTVHNALCTSSVSFEFCNIGQNSVEDSFSFLVSVGEETIIIPFDPAIHEELKNQQTGEYEIKPQQCLTITDNKKLNIASLAMNYGEKKQVEITADYGKEINEENEENNNKDAVVETGEGYFDGEQYCLCGCTKGKCLECPKYPDLIVEKIYPTVHTQNCMNSYYFRICNIGKADLKNGFWITASANGINSAFEFKFAGYPLLGGVLPICITETGECDTSKCIDVINPKYKLDFNVFNGKLNGTQTVTITLDEHKNNLAYNNLIMEEDETNNALTGDIENADEYYYDLAQTEICEAWCYDTDNDGGNGDVWNYGQLTYKYDGIIYGAEYTEIYENIKNQDSCEGENEIDMNEKICSKKIIKYLDTGKFANPYHNEWNNCRDLAKAACNAQGKECGGKCEQGECVILEKDWLQCTDYESTNDPYFKGYIEYVNVDGNPDAQGNPTGIPQKIEDYCSDNWQGNPEYLEDTSCFDKALKKTEIISCYKLKKTYDTEFQGETIKIEKGHVCEKGKCVPTDINNEDCIAPSGAGIDPYANLKPVLEIKLLGEKEWHRNECYGWHDIISMPYCSGVYPERKEYDCTQDGAKCVFTENGAKCSLPDKDPTCAEQYDNGLDLEKAGRIEYSDEYGIFDDKEDRCINNDLLIETYCAGNVGKVTEPLSCAEQGKICNDGACKTASEDNLMCTDNEKALEADADADETIVKDYQLQGYVKGKNIVGEKISSWDLCLDPKEENNLFDQENKPKEIYYLDDGEISDLEAEESNKLLELYCDGTKMKYDTIDCKQAFGETFLCHNGACKEKLEELKTCGPHPDYKGALWYTTGFKDEQPIKFWGYCDDENTVVKAACDSNKNPYHLEPMGCPEGTKCNPATVECELPTYPEKKCEEIAGNKVKITNYFDSSVWNSECDGVDSIEKPICAANANENGVEEACIAGTECSNEVDWVIEPCPANTKCNDDTGQCEQYDPEKNICQLVEKPGFIPYIEYNAGFASTESIKLYQWCDPGEDEVEKYECITNENGFKQAVETEIECPPGTGCNPKTMTCEKPNYDLAKCEGPASEEETDIYTKVKINAVDQFGNKIFLFTEEGQLFDEDFCVGDLIPGEDKNTLAQLWCGEEIDNLGNTHYYIFGDGFDCPSGICQDGVCVSKP